MQAEKYRHLSPSNPLYQLAHNTLPQKRLELRSSWQHLSDTILIEAGFFPARANCHIPCPESLISLQNRKPFQIHSHIAPWERAKLEQHIHISPFIPQLLQPSHKRRKTAEEQTRKRKATEEMMANLPPMTHSHWTDGSMAQRDHHSGTGYYMFPCAYNPNVSLKRKTPPLSPFTAASRPCGIVHQVIHLK